ncbi:transposase [Peribacillus simplex]|uniref:transposase n=1 Tax=Peribacillus simplex TaxID=1478 RepID=UPI003D270CBB
MTKRERRTFTSEFKKQMIQLYQNGKTRKALIEEYELTPSSLDRWIQQGENTGSFKEKDNRSPYLESPQSFVISALFSWLII